MPYKAKKRFESFKREKKTSKHAHKRPSHQRKKNNKTNNNNSDSNSNDEQTVATNSLDCQT